jgi:acyl-coenzyme A synthetase/AMP-(fatty) acid ligase
MFSIWSYGSAVTLFENSKLIVPIPPSWILGLALYVHGPLDFGTVPVLLPTTAPQPITAEYIDKVHTSVHADGGTYIPAVLRELSRNQTYLDHMKHMTWVGFGGAPLDRETGNIFASFLRVQPLMGSTEVGGYGVLVSEPDEWMYYNFDPETGFRFLPYQDDLYESVIVKHTEPGKVGTQIIFHVFPELDVYHTKDVWREHPTKKGLWLMSGRTDDFVKLSSLTKFNATHIENILLKNPLVKAVVMGGEGRKIPFLLVELADERMDEKEGLDALWPAIEETNQEISWEIRLNKEMVIFAKPGKPLQRVMGKGTTNRRATTADYAEEIEGLYRRNAGLMNGQA